MLKLLIIMLKGFLKEDNIITSVLLLILVLIGNNVYAQSISSNQLKNLIYVQRSKGLEIDVVKEYGTDLSGVSLTNMDLRGVKFNNANLTGANLSGSLLSHSSLPKL